MKALKYLIYFISVALVSLEVHGQQMSDPTKFGFTLKTSRQKFTRIPFTLQSNLILLKFRMDNKDTLTMVLDTGVSSNIITNKDVAAKFKLDFTRRVQISGAGEGNPLWASVSVGHQFEIRDLKAFNQNLVVLDHDALNLSEYLGVKVDGIFGHELFNNFVVMLDFERKELRVFPQKKFKYSAKMGEKYAIVVTSSKPYTEALSIVKNGKEIPTRLVIDTGAGHALLLDANSPNMELPSKVIRANLGRGLNGDINGNIGRIAQIKIGQNNLKNVVASYPDSISFATKFGTKIVERNGSIGMELLRRFVITLNYAEGYMAMRPIRDQINTAFERDMSGMDVRTTGEQLKNYTVHSVEAGSPADLVGVKEGDEILFIDSKPIKDYSISEVYKLLSKKEGRKIDMIARRNGVLMFFNFRLKRLI